LIVAVDQNVVGIRPSASGVAEEEALYDVAVPIVEGDRWGTAPEDERGDRRAPRDAGPSDAA
jgi:hypothetical protein